MIVIKVIGYVVLIIILVFLVAFLECLLRAFYISFIVKKRPYNYRKIRMGKKK